MSLKVFSVQLCEEVSHSVDDVDGVYLHRSDAELRAKHLNDTRIAKGTAPIWEVVEVLVRDAEDAWFERA